jgi:nucleoside phosphorylase
MQACKPAKTLRALVVTALPVEYKAVRAHLRDVREVTHSQGTIYEIGDFAAEDGSIWNVCIAEIGPGNPIAAAETERAINYFHPGILLFVGIAGGLKDVSIGDVVAATKVYGYESGKATREFLSRPDSYRSSYDLQQRARVEAKRENWLAQVTTGTKRDFEVFVAPIASGEKVIASRRSGLCRFIRSQYSDAVAVEMEGLGFLVAAAANFEIRNLVIRGISDLVDRKAETDALGSQRVAAEHASDFAFQVLSKSFSTRSGQTAEAAPLKHPRAFVRDPRIDSLIADVRFGELKTSAQPALEILKTTGSAGRNELFEQLLSYQDCPDEEEVFWKALGTIEACCEFAPWLLNRPALFRMAMHENFSVRSSAAFICMNLAQYAPELVPLDILERLSVHDEDWYVQAPANAALKAMVRAIPATLHIFFSRLRSSDPEEREHAASALADIARKEPELLDAEQLRSEIGRLEKLGEVDALPRLKKALNEVETTERAEGYKYGI